MPNGNISGVFVSCSCESSWSFFSRFLLGFSSKNHSGVSSGNPSLSSVWLFSYSFFWESYNSFFFWEPFKSSWRNQISTLIPGRKSQNKPTLNFCRNRWGSFWRISWRNAQIESIKESWEIHRWHSWRDSWRNLRKEQLNLESSWSNFVLTRDGKCLGILWKNCNHIFSFQHFLCEFYSLNL